VATAAVMWASSGTAGRAIIDAGVTPSDLVQIRVTFASLILATFFLVCNRSLLRIAWKDVGYFAFLGGIVMASVQITYFYTISKIHVMAAILLGYMSPVLVAVFSIAFWGERFSLSTLVALVLALVGCYLVVGGYNLELLRLNRLGILGGLAAAVSFAAYALLGERIMRRYPPWTVVFYAMLFAAFTWQVIHPPFHFLYAPYTDAQWAWILYIVVVGTVAPFGLYFVGINHIRSTRAIITATLEPITAGLLAFFFLGQNLDTPQIIGAALVVTAIVVLQVYREQDQLTPEMIRNLEAARGG
jgi:drug/metabolite transporter (DMT)-like permease